MHLHIKAYFRPNTWLLAVCLLWHCIQCEMVCAGPLHASNSARFLETLYSTSTPTTITMALLVDKHRPRSLDQLTYHKDLSQRLRSLVRHHLPQRFPIFQSPILTTLKGTIRRLPAPPRLRPLRRRQEDSHRRHAERTLRTRR